MTTPRPHLHLVPPAASGPPQNDAAGAAPFTGRDAAKAKHFDDSLTLLARALGVMPEDAS